METERPIVNIVGERVAIGPIRDTHFDSVAGWGNDYATTASAGSPIGPRRPERTAAEFGEWIAKPTNSIFALYEVTTWQCIGFTGLMDIDHQHRSAQFTIVIGSPEARGKGYGTEATQLVLDHAFLALGMDSVWLRCLAFNMAGIRAYEKAGFKHVGRIRRHSMIGGKQHDVVLMDILAQEFESPVLGRVLVPDESRK